VDGGYCFTGRKHFGSLSPVWTRLGMHGLDDSDPQNPRIVHAFMPRDAQGYEIQHNWDVLGMRATQSHDTVLDAAFVPDRYIARVVPPGMAGADLFVLATFIWALGGFANVYCGLARCAFDKALAAVQGKRAVTLTRTMAWHPEVQAAVADMAVDLAAMEAHLDRVADDWTQGVDHGAMWGARIVMAKHHAAESAWGVVDRAFELAGGFGIFRVSGWERLLRDARLGRIHPANKALTREIVAKSYLGLDMDELPRWG
jgi:alkylation response protein AidB-like acyl-CoA dehydrogenase